MKIEVRMWKKSHITSLETLSCITLRKKTSSSTDGKHCNCKKTGCLKLYCDCFAAGFYCTEICACQGCYNRYEHADTVLETRQQIELRDPIAFGPKIVQHVNEPNSGENGNCATLTLGRHKRGYNCKKSMLLKKYCECYQAHVVCSSGCRCDGCENVYGRREECVTIGHSVNRRMVSDGVGKERFEGTFDEKLEGKATKKDFLHAELNNPHKLTPLTPSFQCSDHGRAKPTSRQSRSCHQSPESDGAILPSDEDSTKSSRTSNSGDMLPQSYRELLNLSSYNWQQDHNIVEMMDQSHRGEMQLRICALLLHYQIYPSWPWRILLHLEQGPRQIFHPNFPLALAMSYQAIPLILRDSTVPSRPAKVSFPNQRQVSPPPPQSHLHELESRSSGDL